MTLRIARYGNTRHWAVYDAQELVVVTVYRRGALEVLRRLQAQAPGDATAAAAAGGYRLLAAGAAAPARGQEQRRDQRERHRAAHGLDLRPAAWGLGAPPLDRRPPLVTLPHAPRHAAW